MNILFLTNNMPPNIDGVGDYTMNMAREFARHGHKVIVVCKDYNNICITHSDIDIMPIIKFWNTAALTPILEIVKAEKIDVISLQYVPHGFHPKGLPWGVARLMKGIKKSGIKVMTFCHEVCVPPIKGDLKRAILVKLMSLITKRILQQSDYIATSIGWYAKMIRDIMPSIANIPLLPIPSNVPLCRKSKEELAILKENVAPQGEFIVGFIGKRDIIYAVQAVKELISEGYKIKILSIGQTNFLSMESEYIYKTGVLPIEYLADYIAISDCIVLPEGKSGCSFKSGSLMAALCEGKPVITNKGKMTDSSLVHRDNILFAKNKIDFIHAISSLIQDKKLSEYISQGAKKISEKVTWTNTYEQYLRV